MRRGTAKRPLKGGGAGRWRAILQSWNGFVNFSRSKSSPLVGTQSCPSKGSVRPALTENENLVFGIELNELWARAAFAIQRSESAAAIPRNALQKVEIMP